jgi:hypothetical protein
LNSVLEFDACDYCVQHSISALPLNDSKNTLLSINQILTYKLLLLKI